MKSKMSDPQKFAATIVVVAAICTGIASARWFATSIHYVGLRRAIPVAQSLAEAEALYKVTDEATKTLVEKTEVNAESVMQSFADSDSTNIQNLLESHCNDLETLRISYDLQLKQKDTYKAAHEQDCATWKQEVSQITSIPARIAEENRILMFTIKYQEALRSAEQNLELAASVLEDAHDLVLLNRSLKHAVAMGAATESLRQLTTDLSAKAVVYQKKSAAILAAWH